MSDLSFNRKASGLVRSWASFDNFIYAYFSINLVTLGFYIVTQSYYFGAGIIPALIICAGLVLTMVVAYAGLMTVMPRAGGDYTWQSKIFGSGPAFVFAMPAFVITSWLFTPIYADTLRHTVLIPLAGILHWQALAQRIATDSTVFFFVCVVMILWVTVITASGMKVYARVQKVCFWISGIALLVVIFYLFSIDKASFPSLFDKNMQAMYGIDQAYSKVQSLGAQASASTTLWGGSLSQVLLMLPFLAFFLLWPNWGATLAGEMKGTSFMRKNIIAMGSATVVVTALMILVLLGIQRAMGFDFFMQASAAYWTGRAQNGIGPESMPIWPYPAVLALFATDSTTLRVVLISGLSLFFFGWAGTLYLSPSRVLFSASFDRLLPEGISRIHEKTRTPLNALLVLIIPGLIISALYAWNIWGFSSFSLLATEIIAISFFVTCLAACLLPLLKKDIYKNSPIAHQKLFGLPLISIFGAIATIFLGFLIFEWLVDPNGDSGLYFISYRNMPAFIFAISAYVVVFIIYWIMRSYRKKSGLDIEKISAEIPIDE